MSGIMHQLCSFASIHTTQMQARLVTFLISQHRPSTPMQASQHALAQPLDKWS